MKFSWKILLCTMLIMAAACGASGYFFCKLCVSDLIGEGDQTGTG